MKTLLIFLICCCSAFLILTVGKKKNSRNSDSRSNLNSLEESERKNVGRKKERLSANFKMKNASKRKKMSQNPTKNKKKKKSSKNVNNSKRKTKNKMRKKANKRNRVDKGNKVRNGNNAKKGNKVRKGHKAKNLKYPKNRNKSRTGHESKKGNNSKNRKLKKKGYKVKRGNKAKIGNKSKNRNIARNGYKSKRRNKPKKGNNAKSRRKITNSKNDRNQNKAKRGNKPKKGNKAKNRRKKTNRKNNKGGRKNKKKKDKKNRKSQKKKKGKNKNKGEIVTKEWYTINKGKMINTNLVENVDTFLLVDGELDGVLKAGWRVLENAVNNTYKITFESEQTNYTASTKITLYNTGEIKVVEVIHWKDTNRSPNVSYNEEQFVRCFHIRKNCVASMYSSICLKNILSSAATTFLLSSKITMFGEPCLYWNTTRSYNHGYYANDYGNRCVTKNTVDDAFKRAPRCMSANGLHVCFPYCVQVNISTIALGPNSTHVQLTQAIGRTVRLKYENSGNVTVNGDFLGRSVNESFARCYNYVETCIAVANGTCLQKLFSGISLKILENANSSASRKACLPWNSTNYVDVIVNSPLSNLCEMPNGSSYNGHGPWCMTSSGWESCFRICHTRGYREFYSDFNGLPFAKKEEEVLRVGVSDLPYQPLSPTNRQSKVKEYTQREEEPIYYMMTWHYNDRIKVLKYTKYYGSAGTGYGHFGTTSEYNILRCYNTIKNCVAKWNGQCVNTIFTNRDVLQVLSGKTYSVDGFYCEEWKNIPEFHDLPGNKCILKYKNITRNIPWCIARGKSQQCFTMCSRNDLAIKVLTERYPVVTLTQSFEVKIEVRLIESPDKFRIRGGCYDENITRCYDDEKKCVAAWSGTCLAARYPDDVATILSNKNVNLDGETCEYWKNTELYRENVENLARNNLCRSAHDIGVIPFGGGPRCLNHAKVVVFVNCFPNCRVIGHHGSTRNKRDLSSTGICGSFKYTSCDLDIGVSLELKQKMAEAKGCHLHIDLDTPCSNTSGNVKRTEL